MKIESDNIILRDMIESDIEDYVRWFTVPWDNSVNKTVSIYADCSSSLVEQFPPSKAVEWADLM